ncbi:MAG: hypothetical protein AMXMBFR58_36270 [Phycisphaerae bacterium]
MSAHRTAVIRVLGKSVCPLFSEMLMNRVEPLKTVGSTGESGTLTMPPVAASRNFTARFTVPSGTPPSEACSQIELVLVT